MTQNKNKKGIAKKALSISLVAAMLATSNVPVWASGFVAEGFDVGAQEFEAGDTDLLNAGIVNLDQLWIGTGERANAQSTTGTINIAYDNLDLEDVTGCFGINVWGATSDGTTNGQIKKGDKYTVELVGEPDATGNQKAKIVFKEGDTQTYTYYTFNGSKEFEFNLTGVKGELDNTLATVTKATGAEWDGQWGTELKANLDTQYGEPVSITWQKCKTTDDASVKANWEDISVGVNYTPDSTLVKYGDYQNAGDDYLIRVKVVYREYADATEEKTTYSTPIAVQPKKVNAEDIKVYLNNVEVKKITENPSKVNYVIKVVDGIEEELPAGSYEFQGFNENQLGDYQIAVKLSSPYVGSKQLECNTNATDLSTAKGVSLTLGQIDYEYNPEGIVPNVTKVTVADKELTKGTNYDVDRIISDVSAPVSQSEINGGTIPASVTGKDAYTGTYEGKTAEEKINIVPASLADNCVVVSKTDERPAGVGITKANYTDYFQVYYKTADGRKIELDADSFDIVDVAKGIYDVAGQKTTVTIKGTANSKDDFAAGQNFYGKLTVDFTTVSDSNIFDDNSKIPGSQITKGAAFLAEIASAITGDVYMVTGQTETKVAMDRTPGVGETYTGSAITFNGLKKLEHWVNTNDKGDNGKEILIEGVDYDITYNNNTNAGTHSSNPAPSVTITMKGKYSGSRTFKFNIEQKELQDVKNDIGTITFNPLATDATAKELYAPLEKFALSYNGVKLLEGKDYENVWVKWVAGNVKDDTSTGYFEYTLDAHQSRNDNDGKLYEDGNYTGSAVFTKAISAKSLTSSDISFADIPSQEWTGTAAKPALTITDLNGKYTLVEGKDYTVTWKNNVATGTATVTVTGINNRYKDKLQKTFTITSKSLNDGKIVKDYKKSTTGNLSVYTAADEKLLNQLYNDGKAVKADFVVVDANNNKLKEGIDYTVSYSNNINVGTATITITGKGSYDGTLTSTFEIVGKLLTGKFTTSVIADQIYTGEEIKPAVTFVPTELKLEEGKDYEIAYVNNVNSYVSDGSHDLSAKDYPGPYVVARGIGNYAGQIRLGFNIRKADLTSSCVTVSDAEYAGGAIAIPTSLVVKNPVSGIALVEGEDYTVTYSDGVNVGDKGTAVITLKDVDNYTINGKAGNTISVVYNVVKKDLANCDVEVVKDNEVTVMNGDVVVPGTEYDVTVNDNGTVTVKAKADSKNYTGSKTVDGIKKPGDTALRVTDRTTSTVSLAWDKVDGAQGYTIWFRSEYDTKVSRKIIQGGDVTSWKQNGLQPGTKYFYTVRAWVQDKEGNYVFGEQSPVQRGTTKPIAAQIKSVSATNGKVKVVLAGKAAGAKMYSMCYSKSANFDDFKVGIRTTYTTRTFSKTLSAGTYYVRVKSYRDLGNNKRVYGAWSNTVKVVVK